MRLPRAFQILLILQILQEAGDDSVNKLHKSLSDMSAVLKAHNAGMPLYTEKLSAFLKWEQLVRVRAWPVTLPEQSS